MSVRGVLIYPLRRVGVNCEYCGKVQVERHADRPDWVSIHHRCDNPSPGPNQPPMWRKISETEFVGELPPLPESAPEEDRVPGSDASKLLTYEHMREVALSLGYPSITEALEALEALAQSNRRLREGLEKIASADKESWQRRVARAALKDNGHG